MNTETSRAQPSTESSQPEEKARLSLRRETVRTLGVSTRIRTGIGCGDDTHSWTCHTFSRV